MYCRWSCWLRRKSVDFNNGTIMGQHWKTIDKNYNVADVTTSLWLRHWIIIRHYYTSLDMTIILNDCNMYDAHIDHYGRVSASIDFFIMRICIAPFQEAYWEALPVQPQLMKYDLMDWSKVGGCKWGSEPLQLTNWFNSESHHL